VLLIRGGLLSRILRQSFPDMSLLRPEMWLPYVFADIDQALDAIR
jgi:hypothetical protein